MNADVVFKYFHNLAQPQCEQLQALAPLYKSWNEKINVVSRKDIGMLYERHVLHSLAIARYTQFPVGCHVLDFGTGGGFPGIPLAIMFPHAQFHLMDSIGKKIKVVKDIATQLGLDNVEGTHARVEELQTKYDFITCRAVAPLKQIYEWTHHLLQRKLDHEHAGSWLLLKGGELEDEIKASQRVVTTTPLSTYFIEEFFRDKYIVEMR